MRHAQIQYACLETIEAIVFGSAADTREGAARPVLRIRLLATAEIYDQVSTS